MAADILTYDSDYVPVGKDQVQHVEITADIAGAVNACYKKDVLKLPKAITQENAAVLPGTDGQKMSKSYGNVIPLFGSSDEIKKAVKEDLHPSLTALFQPQNLSGFTRTAGPMVVER